MTNAVPHHHQDQHQHHRQDGELPLRKLVVARAFIKCLAIEFFADAGVFALRVAESVLHSLRGLREKRIHVAAFQELHQFG